MRSIPLNATSDSELPARYYVSWGLVMFNKRVG
jgi:hypothetical protein